MNDRRDIPKDGPELTRFVEELKAQWLATIDALSDPFILIDSSYTVKKANLAAAKHAGIDVRLAVGSHCFKLIANRDSPCPGCKLKETVSKKSAQTFELITPANNHYEVSSQPVFTSKGNMEGTVHVYHDRTEAKRLEEKLHQREKLASIGLLAGGVAHEINNPLAGILVFAQMLLREMDKKSGHYQDIVEIEKAAQRCKAIVQGLLDFARTDLKAEATNVDVAETLHDAINLLQSELKSTNVSISTEFSGEKHYIKAVHNRLVQVFVNIIQNAQHAMPNGGHLNISGSKRHSDGLAYYSISDSGIGIEPEHLGKIFDPFFTTKDPGEGTGLGLALCFSTIHELGGEISVSSTLGEGTTFTIKLPVTTSPSLKLKTDRAS